jgi:hypothetical protein
VAWGLQLSIPAWATTEIENLTEQTEEDGPFDEAQS